MDIIHGATLSVKGKIRLLGLPRETLTPSQIDDVLSEVCKMPSSFFIYDLRCSPSIPLTEVPNYAAVARKMAPQLAGVTKGSAFVVSNEMMKIFLQSIFMIQVPSAPVHVCNTIQEAKLFFGEISTDKKNKKNTDQDVNHP